MYCTQCGSANQEGAKFCIKCGSKIGGQTKQNSTQQPQVQYRVSNRNRKIGILWLVLPVGVLIFTLLAWAVVNFIVKSGDGSSETVFNIVTFFLGLLGLFAVLGSIAGIPIGIVYLNKRTPLENVQLDPRSGMGARSEVPDDLRRWNWGAAGLTWIWGISNSSWLTLLAFVPYLNFIWWIICGVKGNEWAWRNQPWESIEEFKRVQKKWSHWGIAIFVLYGVFILLGIIISATANNY